jgi:hypothetical protein
MNLSEAKKGTVVSIAGRKWEVLDNLEGGILCLHHEILCDKEFDEDNCNNWKNSSLREWLNRTFLRQLKEEMNSQQPGQYCSNLVTDDGLRDYGVSVDRVFLLSADQYREYRRFISNADDIWWLITADSTCNNYVRCVSTDGSLNGGYACYGNRGVRPACMLPSFIEVDDQERDYQATVNVKIRCKAKSKEEVAKSITEYFGDTNYEIDKNSIVIEEVRG